MALIQSNADEEKLVGSIDPDMAPTGTQDVDGVRWVVYDGGDEMPNRCGRRGWPGRPDRRRSRSGAPAVPMSTVRCRRRRRSSRHWPRSRRRDDAPTQCRRKREPLTGWTAAPFTAAGYTHDVYRKGEGPGVVLIPEMPGIHPGVLALGNHLVDNGFTVACPSLYGTPGAPGSAAGCGPGDAARLCGKGIRGVRHQRRPAGGPLPAGAGPRPQREDTGQGRRGDRRVLERGLRAGGRCGRQCAGPGAQPAVAADSADGRSRDAIRGCPKPS